jgi:integrase
MLTMTGRLREVMQRRYAARGNSAYVFAGYTDDDEDTPRGRGTKAIRNAIDRAGLNAPATIKRDGRATTHTLRDTFASWLVQRGVSLFKVQALLGHADPRMTMKYAKLAPGAVSDEAAAVLDQLATERAA